MSDAVVAYHGALRDPNAFEGLSFHLINGQTVLDTILAGTMILKPVGDFMTPIAHANCRADNIRFVKLCIKINLDQYVSVT